ncbi:glycosyltransferase [Erysipelothrix urinaevulpis]|uniref:glycosyltransferase n=1 Tax=Erysipelothrix urinaevulpis TaxID=2683717 RepID=UPI00135A9A32|nr:RecX family transcriptional regulator [Erysipelothrix urinaevulpis]
MRIGLFTDTYEPDINGVVISIKTLKNALEKLGHTVYIVTNQPSITQTSYDNNILRLPGVELKFLYGYVMSSPLHMQAMDFIEEMDLDVIHVHSEFGVGLFARYVSNTLSIPLISTYHTTYEDYTHYVNILGSKIMDQFSKKAVAKMSRSLSKSSQIIIAPSEKTKLMLMGYDIKKEIVVIPTGLDLERFRNIDEEKLLDIKSQYVKEGIFHFVYIGRLAKEKGIDVVLEGFDALLKTKTKARLLIVGAGPSMDDLQADVKKRGLSKDVEFIGAVPSDDVPYYYHIADAFTSASLTETQGLTFIEALACGKPVFARPDEPLEGIIIDQETGFLFETCDEFVVKAQEYIENQEELEPVFRQNALNKAGSFSSEAFGLAVLDVYQKALDVFYGRYEITEIEDLGDEVSITLDSKGNEEIMYVDPILFEKRELEVGQEMSRHEIDEIQADQNIYEGYQLALKRISMKDFTSFEMSEYLSKKTELSPDQIKVVIQLLEKRRFIDDERYLYDRVDYLRDQNRGNHWILEDMIKRGYEEEEVLSILENEDYDNYIERGVRRAENFMQAQTSGSIRQREDRLKQHLVRQGYGFDDVGQILNNLTDDYGKELELESLRDLMIKAQSRFERRYEGKEVKNRVIRHALSKGYDYDMVLEIMKEFENEN